MSRLESARGRPYITSALDLQDAAYEMFANLGFAKTSVAAIASAAGCSRATFFNYFRSKTDVFWWQMDQALEELKTLLNQQAKRCDPQEKSDIQQQISQIFTALSRTVGDWDSADIPWIYYNFELIGSPEAAISAGATRLITLHTIISKHLAHTHNISDKQAAGTDPLAFKIADSDIFSAEFAASSICAAIFAAFRAWIAAGANRGVLEKYLSTSAAKLQDFID